MTQGRKTLDQMPTSQALLTLRIIWAALLVGQIALLVVILKVILPGRTQPPQINQPLTMVCYGMLATMVPVGFVVRMMIFRRGRDEFGAIAPGAYGTGNIVFWALCEGVSFFSLICVMQNGSLAPTIYVTAAAVALQVTAFPTGGRMRSNDVPSP